VREACALLAAALSANEPVRRFRTIERLKGDRVGQFSVRITAGDES
jgi:hypothetical protein